jgi:hypothetical protein
MAFDIHEQVRAAEFLLEALMDEKREAGIVAAAVAYENLSARDDFSIIHSGHASPRNSKNLVSSHNRMSRKFKCCAESNPQRGCPAGNAPCHPGTTPASYPGSQRVL